MSDKAISIYDGDKFEVMARTAQAMAQSGFFTDARDVSKAMVKVLAGRELGLGPFASMTGIHIIQGRPAMGANLIATLIKNDPRYDYRVAELTDDICTIVFFEGGQPVGESTFTRADARRAGTKNLDKFPRNMLFARAISNGARWYTPGIFGGTVVYTPEELGADTDADGAVIDWQPAASNGHQPPPPADDVVEGEIEDKEQITADELQALADEFDGGEEQPTYPAPRPARIDGAAWRERLANNPRPTVDTVASAMAAAGVYPNASQAAGAILSRWDDLTGSGDRISTDNALTIWDALVEEE